MREVQARHGVLERAAGEGVLEASLQSMHARRTRAAGAIAAAVEASVLCAMRYIQRQGELFVVTARKAEKSEEMHDVRRSLQGNAIRECETDFGLLCQMPRQEGENRILARPALDGSR